MPLLEEIIQKVIKEEEVDLTWFAFEGEANEYFHKQGLPLRFRFLKVAEDVAEVRIKDHQVAVFVYSTKTLYRVSGSLQLHWALVSRAILQVYRVVTMIG